MAELLRSPAAASTGARANVLKPGPLEYGFWCFLLVAVGRIGQLFPALSNVPLGKVVLGITFLALVAQWKRLPAMVEAAKPVARTGKYLVWLALLLTPISFWKGASFNFLLHQLPDLVAVTAIAYMMSRSWRFVRGSMLALVISAILLARFALSSYDGGRAATDTMYDTNDLAYVLVTIFPLALGFTLTARSIPARLLYSTAAFVLVITSLLTQSRGGLLALTAELVILLFTRTVPGDGRKRRYTATLAALGGAALVGVIIWSHLPDAARNRFATILDLASDYNLDPTDTTGRGEIWGRGIRAALQRPIGYGPNSFSMVDLKFGGRFMAPHNSFIEILVELGLPGLVLFVAAYLLALRGLARVRAALIRRKDPSAEEKDRIVFARLLQVALVGNAIAGFFLSMAYSSLLWTLLGTSMALMALAEREPQSG